MKKFITVLKRLLYFFGGYIMFAVIVALIEFIFLIKLSSTTPQFLDLLKKNFTQNFEAYTCIFLTIFIINFIIVSIVTKILNNKLRKIKRKDD